MENLFILLLVIIAFTPIILIAALIEQYAKFVKSVKDDNLARERREYVEQNLMR